MIVRMLKTTYHFGVSYRRDSEYGVDADTGRRWIANRIAVEVVEPKAVVKPPEVSFTVKELREIAKAKGVVGYSSMKKAELERVCSI